MWYLIPIFFLGVLTPIQTAANSRLRKSVSSPFIASLVSFFVGTVFLFIVTLCEKGGVLIDSELFSILPWWAWLGGVCGLLANSLAIDKYGWFGASKKKIRPVQYLGLLCVMIGIIILL